MAGGAALMRVTSTSAGRKNMILAPQLSVSSQRLAAFQREVQGLIGSGGQAVQMTHLSAGSGFCLTVKMQAHPGSAQGLLPSGLAPVPQVAEQVNHGDRG